MRFTGFSDFMTSALLCGKKSLKSFLATGVFLLLQRDWPGVNILLTVPEYTENLLVWHQPESSGLSRMRGLFDNNKNPKRDPSEKDG